MGPCGVCAIQDWPTRSPEVPSPVAHLVRFSGTQAKSYTSRGERSTVTLTVRDGKLAGMVMALRNSGLLCFVRAQSERGGVDAVAQAGGPGTVLEDVAEVAAARAAVHLGARHPQHAIGLGVHAAFHGRPEAGPAGPR